MEFFSSFASWLMCKHMHAFVHLCTHTCIQAHMHTHLHKHTYTFTHTLAYTFTHVHIYHCTKYSHLPACLYTYLHLHTPSHTYTDAHTLDLHTYLYVNTSIHTTHRHAQAQMHTHARTNMHVQVGPGLANIFHLLRQVNAGLGSLPTSTTITPDLFLQDQAPPNPATLASIKGKCLSFSPAVGTSALNDNAGHWGFASPASFTVHAKFGTFSPQCCEFGTLLSFSELSQQEHLSPTPGICWSSSITRHVFPYPHVNQKLPHASKWELRELKLWTVLMSKFSYFQVLNGCIVNSIQNWATLQRQIPKLFWNNFLQIMGIIQTGFLEWVR
jgi:hypothetical protein